MLDKLDQYLYNTFLELKSDYNSSAPFNKDSVIYNDIVNKILTNLKTFYNSYEKQLDNTFRHLIIELST